MTTINQSEQQELAELTAYLRHDAIGDNEAGINDDKDMLRLAELIDLVLTDLEASTTATTRYRVAPDLDSNPVTNWADQPIFTDGLSKAKKARWLDPDRWQSFMVCREKLCECCGQWSTVDVIGGFDYHDSTDVETPNVGTYSLHELHEDMADHFKEA